MIGIVRDNCVKFVSFEIVKWYNGNCLLRSFQQYWKMWTINKSIADTFAWVLMSNHFHILNKAERWNLLQTHKAWFYTFTGILDTTDFCEHPVEYGWSSYLTCISSKPTKIKRDSVLEWFCDRQNFEYCHKQFIQDDEIK